MDRRDIAAARNGNPHDILDLLHQIPIRRAPIALFFCAAVKRDVLDAVGFGEFRRFDRVDGAVRIARANLDCQWNRDRFLDLFQNSFQSRQIAQ